MRIKIWGARGSIPTPVTPHDVRSKIVSALLNISRIENRELREELLAAILDDPSGGPGSPKPADTPLLNDGARPREIEAKRRGIIEAYLDQLPFLASRTAGGNTPCIELQVGKDIFILDAGSGIRELGLELMKGDCGRGQGVLHIFFSHPHWDHIQGFPFFRPAFVPGNKIFLYGVHDMEAVLRRQQEFINFPVSIDYMQADLTFINLKPEEVLDFDDLRVRNICNYHPGDSYAFRFEKGNKVFVYATDASYPAGADMRPFLNFFSEADLLIYDSQFSQRESDEKEDWGHSSSFVGVEMAQQAKVKSLVLFHHDPTCSDKDLAKILEDTLKFQQNQYPGQNPIKVLIGQEGQTFDLTPHHTTQLQQVPGGKAILLKPTGIFDEHVAAELKEQLLKLRKSDWPNQLIIDMSGVELLQVAGLRALVKLKKEIKTSTMALAGPPISVQQLIELAGYADFFAVYPSVHSALNAIQARETLNLPGQMIKNRYYVETKIGDGHLGTVFKATDTRLNRLVAIKILSPAFSEGAIEQFLSQARQIIELSHPNIVAVYDCDEDRGLSFMVEEIVESTTLMDVIEERNGKPFPLNLALRITEGVARALEYAHSRGVIHGDLKPKNILLGNEVMISDFGLGRLESSNSFLTDASAAGVTTRYLAPEQVLGHPIDARTDLYALGIILYELFTGQPPFGGSDEEVLGYHRTGLPQPPRQLNPKLSRFLEHLILKLLDKDPNQRYATARQVRRILASMTIATSGDTQHRRLPRRRWPALVGRAKVIQRLAELWAETRSGHGQLVFLTGEVGVGKTRLAHELTDNIDDATLLYAHCDRLEGTLAYQPFVEAIEAYFASIPADTVADSAVGQVLAAMSKLVPEVGRFVSLEDTDPSGSPDLLQMPTDSANLVSVMARFTANRPWLLVLDNLHWADQSSLHLLYYLARHCHRLGLMIVGTYRSSEAKNNKFLTETLNSLSDEITYTTIPLEPLPETQAKEMLENIWPQAIPADLATVVYHLTGGNPFYIGEVARGLVDEGVVTWRDDRWYFGPIVEASLPQRPRDAILRRVSRLNKENQALLHRAAVLGHSFNFDDMHKMSGLAERDILANLDLVMERGLIHCTPGEDILHFSHQEIQQAVYESLSSLKRRLLHREAGEALEERHLPEPERIAPALAHHFFLAGELEKGLIYSIQAATQAGSIGASQDALTWYTRALDALDQLQMDEVTQQQRFELLLARELIYSRLGERQAQALDLVALQALAQLFDDPTKQAVVHNRQAIYERNLNRLGEAVTEAQAGLIAARQSGNVMLEAESLQQLGYIALYQGQLEPAQEYMQRAYDLVQGIDNEIGKAGSISGLGTVYRCSMQHDKAEDCYHQALALVRAGDDRYGQATCLRNLGLIYLQAGDYTRAQSYLQQSLEMNRIIGDRRGEAVCLSNLAALSSEVGLYTRAQSLARAAMSIYQTIQDQPGQARSLGMLSVTHLALNDYTAAYDHAAQALEIVRPLEIPALEGLAWLELGLALESLGDLPRAGDAYNQALAVLGRLALQATGVDARAGLARCLLAAGKTAAAAEEVGACLEWIQSYGTRGIAHPVRFYSTAYRVLQAANNGENALAALSAGYDLLQTRANTIGDTELKAIFLRNVPENKELVIQYTECRPQEQPGGN